jgi:AcrR family transcriptional regulator
MPCRTIFCSVALIRGMPPDVGLRERKKTETRAALSRAALELALRDGYDAVTVDAIADAANVSTRTFRNYFSSKEDAVLALLGDVVDRQTQSLLERDEGEPVLDSLEACALELVVSGEDFNRAVSVTRVITEHPALVAHAAAAHLRASDQMIAEIGRRLGADPNTAIQPRLLYHASRGVLATVIELIAAGKPPNLAAQLVRQCFGSLRSGLGDTPPT